MPPLVDDFLYLCDDAYTKENILVMERDVLRVVGYDINIPVTYRFIRRLARVRGGRGGGGGREGGREGITYRFIRRLARVRGGRGGGEREGITYCFIRRLARVRGGREREREREVRSPTASFGG